MRHVDNRKEAVSQLLEQGHASMKDILTVSFGEWPPKGLDINPAVTHSQDVVFERLKREGGLLGRIKSLVSYTAGETPMDGPRIIYVGKKCSPATLTHEGLHTLQSDNWVRLRLLYGGGPVDAFKSQERKSTPRSFMPPQSRAMVALEEYEKEFPKGRLSRLFNKVVNGLKDASGLEYLKDGHETEAFLHEALVEGYQTWHKLPGTREELWAALAGVGVRPPPQVKKELENLPEDSSARHFLRVKARHSNAAVNIQYINSSLSKEAREFFWRDTLPTIYADIIEMYGDRQGRERFGLGANFKGQLQARVFGPG